MQSLGFNPQVSMINNNKKATKTNLPIVSLIHRAMNTFMFILTCFGLFCSIDSAYYYHHKGKKDSLSIKIVFFILDSYDKIVDFIQEIKKRYAK